MNTVSYILSFRELKFQREAWEFGPLSETPRHGMEEEEQEQEEEVVGEEEEEKCVKGVRTMR